MKEISKKTLGIRQAAKEKKQQAIIASSLSLFCTQGIEKTSMEQIAVSAGIGSATIYRYFSTKPELVLAAALSIWSRQSDKYLPCLQTKEYRGANGKKQLSTILSIFLCIYKEDTDFLRFLSELDPYIKNTGLQPSILFEYETFIISLKQYATDALKLGLSDGSLCFSARVDDIYYTLFHSMLSTTQKLALQGNILPMNSQADGLVQLTLLRDLLLNGL